MSELVKLTSDTEFNVDVVQSNLPVLVDFFSTRCAPCKMMEPVLEEVAEKFQRQVKFYKINVDKNQNTPSKYHVRSIPFLIFFKFGEVQAIKVGTMTKSHLMEFIEENL